MSGERYPNFLPLDLGYNNSKIIFRLLDPWQWRHQGDSKCLQPLTLKAYATSKVTWIVQFNCLLAVLWLPKGFQEQRTERLNTSFFPNTGDCLPSDLAQHLRRLESSNFLLLASETSQFSNTKLLYFSIIKWTSTNVAIFVVCCVFLSFWSCFLQLLFTFYLLWYIFLPCSLTKPHSSGSVVTLTLFFTWCKFRWDAKSLTEHNNIRMSYHTLLSGTWLPIFSGPLHASTV